MGAFIHHLGEAAYGDGQTTALAYQSVNLTLPADVTASPFYITNVHNRIIGNAASGGWSGFAFPSLKKPIGAHKDVNMRPSSRLSLEIDGNTAHSTGWWWYHSAGFYFGGALYTAGHAMLVEAVLSTVTLDVGEKKKMTNVKALYILSDGAKLQVIGKLLGLKCSTILV